MTFGLKNAPTIFSRVVIVAFKEFIHQFLEVYLDDWTVYNLLKDHVEVLRLMLERCRKCQLSLNIKKTIFITPIEILLGHIVCRQGLIMDPPNIAVIVNLPPPKSVCQLWATLGNSGYYRKFIKGCWPLVMKASEDQGRKGKMRIENCREDTVTVTGLK
jgi:hypothetical protein